MVRSNVKSIRPDCEGDAEGEAFGQHELRPYRMVRPDVAWYVPNGAVERSPVIMESPERTSLEVAITKGLLLIPLALFFHHAVMGEVHITQVSGQALNVGATASPLNRRRAV